MFRTAALLVWLTVSAASHLTSVDQEDRQAADVRKSTEWWARIGERVFFAPPVSMMELGQGQGQGLGSGSGSSYYYSLGSSEALTPEMEKHRVGGEGVVHIFHLPEGPSSLRVESSGSRRAAFSSLVQLQRGEEVLANPYPPYHPRSVNDSAPTRVREVMFEASKHITQDQFSEYLNKIVSIGDGTLTTRSWENPTAEHNAVATVEKLMGDQGLQTCLQTFSFNDKEMTNVIGWLPGSELDSGTVVIGGHYDSRPYSNAPAPGSNDNGSGVAAMLSVAQAFHKAGLKPKKNVFFVGFGGEEPGLVGSAHFAKALLEPTGPHGFPSKCLQERPDVQASFLQTHTARRSFRSWSQSSKHQVIIMDEIGWVSPQTKNHPTVVFETYDRPGAVDIMDSLDFSNQALNSGQPLGNKGPSGSDHMSLLQKGMNSGQRLGVQFNKRPFGSDHMSFLQEGVSAVLVINANDAEYPGYHSSNDTLGYIDFDYATKITKLVFGAAGHFADISPSAAAA